MVMYLNAVGLHGDETVVEVSVPVSDDDNIRVENMVLRALGGHIDLGGCK